MMKEKRKYGKLVEKKGEKELLYIFPFPADKRKYVLEHCSRQGWFIGWHLF
jgi:hypothetical protein